MDDETPLYFCGTNDPLIASVVRGWGKRTITWAVAGSLPAVSAADLRAAVRNALDVWADATTLRFEEARQGSAADLLVTTGRIDGPLSVLAWCELPDGSDRQLTMKLDTSERFSLRPARGQIGLMEVILHEFGHGLGLDHDQPGSGSVMAPAYAGLRELQPNDRARIQKLYGAAAPPPEPGRTITIIITGAESIRIPGWRVVREE